MRRGWRQEVARKWRLGRTMLRSWWRGDSTLYHAWFITRNF